jgi:hypothetical protein
MIDEQDIIYRLRKRAEIRRQISTRKSVQEGKPDRIATLLDEAAAEIDRLRTGLQNLAAVAWPSPEEGHTGFVDRLGMQFYRETRIWPPFKSEPMEIARDVDREEASRKWREWLNAKRDAAAAEAARILPKVHTDEP